jgi:predicted nucleic acid-binding protein
MYVFDATPLIYLAKTDSLALVDELDTTCCLPERVVDDVVTAEIEQGHADARPVDRALDDGVVDVRSATELDAFGRLETNQQLSAADAAVLAIADACDGTAITDDQYGRDVAAVEDIQTRGTGSLVMRCLDEGILDADDARDAIDRMLDVGWYCAPDLYAKIRRTIDDLA